MIRRTAALSLLLLAAAASAQQPSQAERARLMAMSSRLGQCHHGIVLSAARTGLNAGQIVDRALAACAGREAPIRAELTRQIGPQRASAVMQAQRAHWREAIARMVVQARAGR